MQYQTNPIDLNRTCDDWKTIAKASSVRCGTCDPTKEIPIGVGNGCLFSCCIPLVEAPQAIQNVNNYNSATPPLGTKCGATSANWSTKNKCGTAGGCSDSKQMCKLNSSSQYACQYVNGYCGYSKLDEKVFYDALYSGPTITDIMKLITPIAQILYYGGLFIGMCFIVYSGYILMTSEGNPEMTQQGQQQLTAAILGILFILLSSAILRVIINSLIGGNISI